VHVDTHHLDFGYKDPQSRELRLVDSGQSMAGNRQWIGTFAQAADGFVGYNSAFAA
jgi:hypothetical protein